MSQDSPASRSKAAVAAMLAAFLVLGLGEELWLRFFPKYLELLGASAWGVALYGGLRELLEALYPYPGGWLADRLGRKTALVLFAALAAAGYAAAALAPSWLWLLAATLLTAAWSHLTLPAVFAVLAEQLPRGERATGFGVQSILKRLPIIVAPPLGGLLIAAVGLGAGVRLGLVLTLALALVAILVLRRFFHDLAPGSPPQLSAGMLWRHFGARLKRLLVADCLARWAEGLPKVFVVLFVLDVLGASTTLFGGLTSLQMIVSTLAYIPLARLADRMDRKPFVLATFGFFALFPLVLAEARGGAGLALAFVVAGLREVGEPARKAQIVELVPAEARAQGVGLYYLVRGLVVFPASLVGGWLWTLDPRWPFYAAFGVGLLACAVYIRQGDRDEMDHP